MSANKGPQSRDKDNRQWPAAAEGEPPAVLANWTDEDVCRFHGFSSIELLMKEPNFPKPLPYCMRGRRWHPQEYIDYRERLAALARGEDFEPPPPVGEKLPVLDREAFARSLGVRAGRSQKKAAR